MESGAHTFEAATPEPLVQESFLVFDSEASYDCLNPYKVEVKPVPDFIPRLNFHGLPEYVSSDEEEEYATN